MKKFLRFALGAAFCLGFSTVSAQDAKLYFYDEMQDDYMLCGYLNKVSSNGEYAVGYDNIISEVTYMWRKSTGKLEILNDASEHAEAIYDVSNDGTVVGTFFKEDKVLTVTMRDGTERTINGAYVPGYKKDGVLTELPVPEQTYLCYTDKLDYAPSAVAISDDGKVVGGYVQYNDGKCYPVVWKDGKMTEFSSLELESQGFVVQDVSNDGNLIVGFAESEWGDRLPAVVENGTLKKLYDVTATPSEREFFAEGMCWRIDAHNNVVGYLQDVDGVMYGFIYNAESGMKYITEVGQVASASLNSNLVFGATAGGGYGTATVITGGKTVDLKEYLNIESDKTLGTVMDVSADGKVIVGAGLWASDYGLFNVPFVIEVPEGITAGIGSNATAEKVNARVDSYGTLFVTGVYDDVEVYGVSGSRMLKSSAQGGIFDMSSFAPGVYVVKVASGNNISTFKVMKK